MSGQVGKSSAALEFDTRDYLRRMRGWLWSRMWRRLWRRLRSTEKNGSVEGTVGERRLFLGEEPQQDLILTWDGASASASGED